MVKTLGTQKNCSHQMPFAMLFAVEPAFTSISEEYGQENLCYNARFQINEETQLASISGVLNSTSIKKSTNSGLIIWHGDKDDDNVADE
ncbi:hypothetical protein [Arthrospira platensis]|uniref:Uncharacterized protein n=2 Tax=Limnospira platensis TaxID=118562 RepID=A0A5M3T0S5_LIMPL|nr:hypothetical protein [Arthrospira platensis]AMW30636.1 hypothetical protein AP285_24550 [Arthrospira platensis YZ]KDR56672.1 hypothetical protein APPUASWS_015730 [Arthrospira platensis str. Paraca]MBD2670594.1 hypothetical protein [Arthrospira platensis FACHB-439]MBD2711273.1 hypothetical protein [Arthrospira platensis FACHB-835]MDF2207381.1 hypothetical protein [Arthrospira platensis NCB002]MDT9183165.1 hypothetical protein [Limnospira sp. PMC 289.06]MDT9296049.1 hypothetical protein [Ar